MNKDTSFVTIAYVSYLIFRQSCASKKRGICTENSLFIENAFERDLL